MNIKNDEGNHYLVQSQKAKGLLALQSCLYRFELRYLLHYLYPQQRFRIQDLARAYGQAKGSAWFARPCPVLPRHGFVDSRPIRLSQLPKLLYAVKQVELDGELIVGPMVTATHNSVITDHTLSIGPGHDGATGGKQSITLPVTGDLHKHLRNLGFHSYYDGPAPSENETWYLEAVAGHTWYEANIHFHVLSRWLTQVRIGPTIEGHSGDYIPHDGYKVTHVVPIDRCMTLLEWESYVKKLPKGTAVYGSGEGLTSHWGVHCALRSVAFVTSHVPEKGEILQTRKAPVNPRLFWDGAVRGWHLDINEYSARMYGLFVIAACHLVPLWRDHPIGLYLLGAACAIGCRLAACAVGGEMRYAGHQRGSTSVPERNTVYRDALIEFPRKALERAPVEFCNGKGYFSKDPDDSSTYGYGGPKWARCARETIRLHNALAARQRPSRILNALNRVVHVSHNGAALLTKFVDLCNFNEATRNPGLAAASAMSIIYGLAFWPQFSKWKPGCLGHLELQRIISLKPKLKRKPIPKLNLKVTESHEEHKKGERK